MPLPLAELHEIRTDDGVIMEGLLFRARRGKVVVVWLSGLTGRFTKNPERINSLASLFTRAGIAYATFDHRGASSLNHAKVVTKAGKRKRMLLGTSAEKFEHSVHDIRAIIQLLKKEGYKKIFLLGHSTGANKSAYYIQKTGGRGLAGVALLGAVSDIPSIKHELGEREYQSALNHAKRMISRGQGQELIERNKVGGRYWTANRFWSIAREGSNEDVFPYYDWRRHFNWAKHVRLPVLVLIGDQEEHAHQPVEEIIARFKKELPPKYFSSAILKGANHSFYKKAAPLSRTIIKWIRNTE